MLPSTSTCQPPTLARSESSGPDASTRPSPRITARVADPLHLVEQVRREHDVDPVLGADPAHEGEHVVALHRVEPVGGLVEQQQVRVVGEGGGELDPLLLPGRHGAEGAEPLLAQAHLPERVAAPGHGVAMGETVHLGQVGHEVDRPHVGGEVVVLGGVADEGPDAGPGVDGVEAEHLDRALVGPGEAEHEAHEGRLARAVGADQPGDAVLDR